MRGTLCIFTPKNKTFLHILLLLNVDQKNKKIKSHWMYKTVYFPPRLIVGPGPV